jgi:hypothetical protein
VMVMHCYSGNVRSSDDSRDVHRLACRRAVIKQQGVYSARVIVKRRLGKTALQRVGVRGMPMSPRTRV